MSFIYCIVIFFLILPRPPISTLFPYTTLFRSLMLICILTKNAITSCSVTMMLFLHLEVKPLMTLTTVLYLSCALISGDRKSGSAGMPRPISYAVFCLKKTNDGHGHDADEGQHA